MVGPGWRLIPGLALLAWAAAAPAAPYLPRDDAQVLERLPVRAGDPAWREVRRLRQELSRNTQDLGVALTLAERYYGLALAEGDPRYIGYAQSALKPWWDAADAPAGALLLRATLRQYLHDFDGAIADLDRALAKDSRNGAAWFQRAVIHIVQARYPDARRDCEGMRGLYADLMVLGCAATVEALSGGAEAAYAGLRRALDAAPAATPTQRLWVLTRLAEIADRLGLPAEADRHFRQALAVGIRDNYLLAVYAEFLLDQNRPAEVVALLKGHERSDVLLVRLALAEKAMGLRQAAGHEATIRARFDAARLRGDKLHLQDEARFTLQFLKRPKEALKLAQENYLTQREPGDARMLMEAALGAGDPRAAKPALDWLANARHEDVYIRRLAEQLRKTAP
ncbi:MAG: hypothetical protein HYU77_05945 [Betaproteobacteria bacterium]|nr:hypothetical protein [Betaproteobacteria bacterium]